MHNMLRLKDTRARQSSAFQELHRFTYLMHFQAITNSLNKTIYFFKMFGLHTRSYGRSFRTRMTGQCLFFDLGAVVALVNKVNKIE